MKGVIQRENEPDAYAFNRFKWWGNKRRIYRSSYENAHFSAHVDLMKKDGNNETSINWIREDTLEFFLIGILKLQ